MKGYLWETHLHTSETSHCAKASAADMMRVYHAKGYSGVIVTDHFLNDSCLAPYGASWQKRIDVMLRGYLAAKEAGEAYGIPVLLGWEHTDQGGDYLTFGLTEEFLRDQENLCDLPLEVYAHRVHSAGGFLSQAHPYRETWYLPILVAKRWDVVDAIEVVNGSHQGREMIWDEKARVFAKAHSLLQTAGSDAHNAVGAAAAAMNFSVPIGSNQEFLSALRAGKGQPLRF